jgi:hypothetical protein
VVLDELARRTRVQRLAAGRRTACVAIVLGLVLMPTSAPAEPSPIQALIGSWGGSGRVSYTDGSSETIRCTAYYSGGGSDLGMAIQCRSERNTIHVRSKLQVQGARVSGDWEERTFNVSGTASGRVSGGSMSLSLAGGGVTGSMSVTFSRSTHNVTIATQGVALSRVTMSFSRR